MLDQVALANQALGHIGEDDQIQDLNEDRKAARTVKLHWEPTRLFVLSKVNWSFASRTIEITARDVNPEWPIAGGRSAFPLPVDMIRFVEILDPELGDDDNEFSIETGPNGQEIIAAYTDVITIRIVLDSPQVRDPARWPAEFAEAFSYRLAYDISDTLSADKARKAQARNEFAIALRDAKKANARTKPYRRNPPTDWTRARQRGGSQYSSWDKAPQ